MSNDRMHDLDASNKALWAEVKAVRAENDRLRAELADVAAYRTDYWVQIERAVKAEAAIARVRVVLEEDVDDDAARYNALRALDGAE